jgi:hypothetical protein
MKRYLLALFICLFAIADTFAQGCSMCTKVASGLGAESAKGLNFGILYLGCIPLLFMGIMFYKWYKSNKASEMEDSVD